MTTIHLAAEKACHVARSVNKTPTAAVLKEALRTMSEIELLPHLGYFTVSLAMFWRVWFLTLMTFFHYIISKLPEQVKTYQPLQLKYKWRLWDCLTMVQCWVLKWRIKWEGSWCGFWWGCQWTRWQGNKEARGFPEVTDLSDIPNAGKSYWIGCASIRVRCRGEVRGGMCSGQLLFFFSSTK